MIIRRLVAGFLADGLKQAGIYIGEGRAWRLCSPHKLWSTAVKQGRKGKRFGPAANEHLLRRDFTALEPF